jgi:ribonuclease PH
MSRIDGRTNDQLRPVEFRPDYVEFPEGSVLVSFGKTRVLCNVSIDEKVPPWMNDPESDRGWITAEYALLPRSTTTRVKRETMGLSGRTQEIKRLIGRSLRAGFDLNLLGKRTLIVDCDVIQADGGTRCAAITGGYVATRLALGKLIDKKIMDPKVILSPVAAISVGMISGEVLLDLNYEEDSNADADINIVMNQAGDFIEVQGTGEGATFSRSDLDIMLNYAEKGIQQLFTLQGDFY